jgi:hypothetical protein
MPTSTVSATMSVLRAAVGRQRDMAPSPVDIMPRRNENQQNPGAPGDQPGDASEVPARREAAASRPPVVAAHAAPQIGDEPAPGLIGEGLVNTGSEGGTESAEASPKETAETRSRRAFFGRSGHLAVMSEFLHRRINVAIPEVDVGDDVFVVKGSDDTVTRVQVKSATATPQADSYFALFNVPLAQLSVPRDTPALVYIFVARFQNRWSEFIVIRRSTLFARVTEGGGKRIVPLAGKAYVQIRIVFTKTGARCGPVDYQRYRDAWDPWPPLQLEEEDAPPVQAQGNAEDAASPVDTLPIETLREPPRPHDNPPASSP